MPLPTTDNLRAKISKENTTHSQWLENLKTSLKTAYRIATEANKKSHQRNKRLYDKKAKLQKFEINNLVYSYNPERKPGLTRKFPKFWTGPYKVTAKYN
jgi:hypothetical protein